MSEISKGEQLRGAIEDFNNDSMLIDSFKPKILKRLDSHNVKYYVEKITEGGNTVESEVGYYGRLNFGMRRMIMEMLKIDKLDKSFSFPEFNIKAVDCTKDLNERVTKEIVRFVKDSKKNGKKS